MPAALPASENFGGSKGYVNEDVGEGIAWRHATRTANAAFFDGHAGTASEDTEGEITMSQKTKNFWYPLGAP